MAKEILAINGILGPLYKLIECDNNLYLYRVENDIMGNSYLALYKPFVSDDIVDVLIGHLVKGYKKELELREE